MALSFPDSPNINDTYTSGTRTWMWDGTAWGMVASGIVGPTGPTGPTGATGPTGSASTVTGPTGAAGNWASAQTVVTKTASYQIAASDVGYLIIMNVATACNLTVPSGLGLTQGQRIDIFQLGAGQVTVVASGTTIRYTPTLKLRAQYSSATLIVGTSANTFYLVGDLAAS